MAQHRWKKRDLLNAERHMTRYELVGFSGDLEVAAEMVASVTGEDLEPHSSSYLGEYFRVATADGGEIVVRENAEDEEGYLAESDFPEQRVLVYLDGVTGSISERLIATDGFSLLRSEEV
jgi:hypothetical protein